MSLSRTCPLHSLCRRLLIGLWLAFAWSWAIGGVIDVWTPRDGALQKGFLNAFDAALKNGDHRIGRVIDLSAVPHPDLPIERVVVALGKEATEQALDAGAPGVLSVLVSRRDALTLQARDTHGRLGAIVLDQPIPRRLAMLRILAPEVATVAILSGSTAPLPADVLTAAIRGAGFTPRLAEIEREQEIVPALERILTPDAALLATPDPSVFNRDTVMSILLTSYRHRRPVIGFTPGYVRAGAVAGVFSTPEDIALQAAKLLGADGDPTAFARGIHDPALFRVAVNERVSRSLGLMDIGEDALLSRLQAWEAGR